MIHRPWLFVSLFLSFLTVFGLAPDAYSLIRDGGPELARLVRSGRRRPDVPRRVFDYRQHPDVWGRWS